MKLIKLASQYAMGRVVLFAFAIAAIYFFMYYDDGAVLEAQITELKSQVTVEQIKKKDTEATIKKEDEMRANLASLARDLQVVKAKIPNELKDTEMTAIINKASARAGVSVFSLARKKDNYKSGFNAIHAAGGVYGATSSSVGSNSSHSTGSESVEEIAFDLTLNGSFNRLVQFVEILSREEKIIRLRDFTIERSSSNVSDSAVRFKGDIIGFKQAQDLAKASVVSPSDAKLQQIQRVEK